MYYNEKIFSIYAQILLIFETNYFSNKMLHLEIKLTVYFYLNLKHNMRIFQSRDNNLVEIHEESFDLERTIQNLVEKNLDSIFSGLEFVESEFQIDDLRPDTIAFEFSGNHEGWKYWLDHVRGY
jgi:hypothetical protein